VTVVVRSDYGWRGDGKSADEIAGDIEHTRRRLDADLRLLRAKLIAPKRIAPIVALGVAAAGLLLRRVLRRR
jgi:hypothetical protein